MIGASDLSRLPRWTPARQSDELRRYVKAELGGSAIELGLESPTSSSPHGVRAWLAARIRPAFAKPATSEPLRAALGAVHFSGETAQTTRETAPPAALLATSAMAYTATSKCTESDELCTCDV